MHPDVTAAIRSFVVNSFLFGQEERLKNDDSFLAEGLIDSTGILELVTLVEETYGFQVEDNELVPENFDSVNRIASYVTRKLNGGGGSIVSGVDSLSEPTPA